MYFTNKQGRTRPCALTAFAASWALLCTAAHAVVSVPAQAPSTAVAITPLAPTNAFDNATGYPWYVQAYDAGSGVGGTASTAWDGTVGHTALGSARLTMGTPGVNFIYTLPSGVSFASGSRYAAQVWVKSSTNNASLDFMIRGGGNGFFPYAVQHVVATTSWQQVTIQGIPAEAGAGLMVSNATPGATFWMDDVVIAQISKNEYAPLNSTSPIPGSLFGLHLNKVLTGNFPWPAQGQNIIRLHDNGTTWCDLETTVHASDTPTYDTARLDAIISYIAAGFNSTGNTQGGVIYTLGQTPQIYSSMPHVGGNYYCTNLGNTGASAPPTDMTKWDNYVRFIGNHLKGKVKYYEIWNEWDVTGNYAIGSTPAGVAAMVTMTQHAHDILKQIDPGILILSPSVTARSGTLLLEQFLSAGGGAYVDVINFHGTLTGTPDQFIGQIENIRAIMANHQVGALPIADTEGSMICDPHSPYTGFECPTNQTTAQVNAFPLLNHLLLWARGVVNFNYYTWEGISGPASELVYGVDPVHMPIPSGCNPYACKTPLGTIYAQAVAWLKNATVTDGYKIAGAVGGESVYVFKMKDSAGRFEVIMWADGAGESVKLDAAWNTLLNITTLNGSTTPSAIAASRLVPVGNTPVLLTSF